MFAVKSFKYLILLGIIAVPLFGHLDSLPVRVYDEARLAINAYEMLKGGNLIVTHYDGQPDLWNTKPPLLIWIQALTMKLMGVNELALRLPSAIAALLTCMALLVFSIRYLSSFWFGFIAVLVLITSQGYVSMHVTRTGDYDALLTLFTTLYGLCFFVYCERRQVKWLYLFLFFMALSVLTKSIVGLIFTPALLIYSLIYKHVGVLLRNKHFYIGLMAFAVIVVGYYGLREFQEPGYMQAVKENELGGRYLTVIEHHKESFWFYFDQIITERMEAWHLFVLCGLVLGLVSSKREIQRITAFAAIMIMVYFLVISTAKTKLVWYDAPLYPFLVLLASVALYYVFDALQNMSWNKAQLIRNVVPFLFIFLISIAPYRRILDKTYRPIELGWEKDFYEISRYFRSAVKGKIDIKGDYILFEGYNAHILFYLKLLEEKGINIAFKDWTKLSDGDRVIAYQPELKEYIEHNYDALLIETVGNVNTFEIHEPNE